MSRERTSRKRGVGSGSSEGTRPGVRRRGTEKGKGRSLDHGLATREEKRRRKARQKGRGERKTQVEKETHRGREEWKEEIARVGTGYRVRKEEKDGNRRWFDVGYSDRKTYKRKPGREAKVDQSNTGRTVMGKGKEARVKVMNAVVQMEKRRPASEYTGSGIRRKSRVGKLKLKPTKPQAKQ